MIETCKMCGQDGTPWSSVPELKGHICFDCSHYYTIITLEFEQFLTSLAHSKINVGDGVEMDFEDVISPRMAKRAIIAIAKQWCNMHYKKGTVKELDE